MSAYYLSDDCKLLDFTGEIDNSRKAVNHLFAESVQQGVPLYRVADLALHHAETRQALQSEWAQVLMHGAGVVVLAGAYSDTSVVDACTGVFEQIIADQHAKGDAMADHFAAGGANDRIWNSLQKLGERDPGTFVRYFGNTALQAVCEAWLGPNYQMTAQVNLVRPGGAAQLAHRDYHLGFQSAELSALYPAHVHQLSPVLTLQGAVAHTDMPVESGPTKLLPGSQRYASGYMAWRRDDFREYFESHCVQIPLQKGDALFFNPALFHAAGANTSSDIQRMANLLQVSSAFGRAMETVDRVGLSEQLYPSLLKLSASLSEAEIFAAIASSAEGYAFPTNLDTDPPVDGLAPLSQQALLKQSLRQGLSLDEFKARLAKREDCRRA